MDEFEDRYSYTPHESQQLLTKLRGIFENLLQSDALGIFIFLSIILEIAPEEQGIVTLPLLRIMNSFDVKREGVIEMEKFRKILIEFFPILTPTEVAILCTMAKNISVAEVKDLKGNESEIKYISYYHLIMQIEKYYTYQKKISEES